MNKRLILWDIDGTLVRSGRSGQTYSVKRSNRCSGRRPQTASDPQRARPDRQIVEEYLALQGSQDPAHIPAVLYSLEQEFARQVGRIAAEGSPCLGGEAALRCLSALAGVEQTVLTGNIAPNALLKLAAFGLDRYLDLEVGAYGIEHSDRRSLLPLAWKPPARAEGSRLWLA